MLKNKRLNNLQLIIIVLISGLIILTESIEVLMKVKDIGLYDELKRNLGINMDYNQYISINLIEYLQNIIIPLLLSIYTFFTYRKVNVNIIYKGIWLLFLISNLVFNLMEFNIGSLFDYISIILNLLLIFYIGRIRLE